MVNYYHVANIRRLIMISDYILGKFRRTSSKGRISSGNAWLVYEIEYNRLKYKKRYLSMREINRVWSGKPTLIYIGRSINKNRYYD